MRSDPRHFFFPLKKKKTKKQPQALTEVVYFKQTLLSLSGRCNAVLRDRVTLCLLALSSGRAVSKQVKTG